MPAERPEVCILDSNQSVSMYCLHCISGKESQLKNKLNGMGYSAFVPIEIKRTYGSKPATHEKTLLPGYVFFEFAGGGKPDWRQIKETSYVIKILEYSDGNRALRDDDLGFIEWMKRINFKLDISNVIQIGTKIKVIDGPLKDYEGQIAAVKKQRKYVAIKINLIEQASLIWCPIEYIEAT